MRVGDRAVLDVDPQGVVGVSAGLRSRAVVVADQRRVCERIGVVGPGPSIGSGLAAVASVWGSGAARWPVSLTCWGWSWVSQLALWSRQTGRGRVEVVFFWWVLRVCG